MPSTVYQYITPPTAARLLGYSAVRMWQLAKLGKLGPVKQIGRTRYLLLSELERIYKIQFTEEQVHFAARGGFATLVTITERDIEWLGYIRRRFGYTGIVPPNPRKD